MNRLLFYWLILIIFSTIGHSEIIGGYTSDFLDYGISAQAISMGRAGRTLVNSAATGYWNSACLADVKQLSIGYMNVTLMADVAYSYMGFSSPVSKTDVIAVNYMALNVSQIEKHGRNSAPSATPDGLMTAGYGAVMVSYGKQINSELSVGVTGKYGFVSVDNAPDRVVAMDIAFSYHTGSVRIGGNFRNLGSIVLEGNAASAYLLDADLGLSIQLAPDWIVAMDISRFGRGQAVLYGGVEYTLTRHECDAVLFRAGFNEAEISAGVGLNYSGIAIDYAVVLTHMDIVQHYVSMALTL